MAELKHLVRLRRLLLQRGTPGGTFEKGSLKTLFAWFIGILMIRLSVNAFFVRTAVIRELCTSALPLISSMVFHELVLVFLMTLFMLQTGGGPGRSQARFFFSPLSRHIRIIGEILCFLTGPYFWTGFIFFIPLSIPLFSMPDRGWYIFTAVCLHICAVSFAFCVRSFLARWSSDTAKGRGFAVLLLLMAALYMNPEYQIRDGAAFWRTYAGQFSLAYLHVPFLDRIPQTGGVGSENVIFPILAVILFFFLSYMSFSFSADSFIRRKSVFSWRPKKMYKATLTVTRRYIAETLSFPGGIFGVVIALAGGVYLYLLPEGGFLPLLFVSFAALFPVFRLQVCLLGKSGESAPRYVWASVSLDELFKARLWSSISCGILLLLPLIPAALRTGESVTWFLVLVFVLVSSTSIGLVTAMVWPDKSMMSLLSLLVPGGICILSLLLIPVFTGEARRNIGFSLMIVVGVILFILLLRRSRHLGETEQDKVLLSSF